MEHLIDRVNISESELRLLVPNCPEDHNSPKYFKWKKDAAAKYIRARLKKMMLANGKMADYNIDVHKFDEDLRKCCVEKIRCLEKDLEDANIVFKDDSETKSANQKTYIQYRKEIPRNVHWIMHNDEENRTTVPMPRIRPMVFDPAHFPVRMQSSNLLSCPSTVPTDSTVPTINSVSLPSYSPAPKRINCFQCADINFSAKRSVALPSYSTAPQTKNIFQSADINLNAQKSVALPCYSAAPKTQNGFQSADINLNTEKNVALPCYPAEPQTKNVFQSADINFNAQKNVAVPCYSAAPKTQNVFQSADINSSAQNSIPSSSDLSSIKKLSEISDCLKTPDTTEISTEISSYAEPNENELMLITHKAMNILLLNPCEHKEGKHVIADEEISDDLPTSSSGSTLPPSQVMPAVLFGVPAAGRKKCTYEVSLLESIPEQDEAHSNSSSNLEKTKSSQGAINKISVKKILISENIKCPVTGCVSRLGISDATFLAHILLDHVDVRIQETYADCDTVLVFDSGSIARYHNTVLGVIIYHGKLNEEAPGKRNFSVPNQFIPCKHEKMIDSLPIILMACKLPKSINKKQDQPLESDMDIGTVIFFWLLGTRTSKPLYSDVRVYNRKTAKAKNTRVRVRTLDQPQNVMDFLCNESDYTFICDVDDKIDLVQVDLNIQEF